MDLAQVLHSLADPSRLRAVSVLARSMTPVSCADLNELSGPPAMPKSTFSHHLRVLREAGVISGEWDGQRKWVTLRRDDLETRFPGLLDAVLDGFDVDIAHK
jgi:DNA-binding transcriptional ArsR family regulator